MFFNKDSNNTPMIFDSQSWIKHMLDEKELIISLSTRFFFKCLTVHVSKVNLFLDLKQNMRQQKLRIT